MNNRSIIDESSIEFRGEDVLYFTTENVTSRSIPVEIDQSGELGDTYHLENLACTPSEVTVTAPESVMAKVSKVVAQIDLHQKLQPCQRYWMPMGMKLFRTI